MSALQKLSEAPKIQLCEDFGQSPLLLAHLTHDRSIIGVISLVGGFIAMAALGLPGAAIVGFAALNDLKYCAKTDQGYSNDDRTGEQPVASETEGDGAIDVPAVTVDGDVKAIAPSMSSPSVEPRDIATDLGNNPQSALVFGTPGAGKGMNISNAIRTLRAKMPNVTIMMVDPKGDPKERGYWESQVDIFESRSLLKSAPRSSAEWMMRCMEKFVELDGPKLLIWDELFATITVLKGQHTPKGEDAFPCLTDFQQFMGLHLSLGPSTGVWVWGMSQSANLSDLGLTSGGLGTTRIIALVSPDNKGSVEAFYATKAITAPKGGMETIESLMESSPVGRACYDGKTKRWYPMARLENHSGFDRDNADWNNLGKSSPTTETRSPSPSMGYPMNPPSSSSTPTRSRRGRITIPTRKDAEQVWQVSDNDAIEVNAVEVDPAIELINNERNPSKRDALMIAYQWAIARQEKGESVDRQTFLERARKDRNCEYLKDNRDEIWEELLGLLD